MTHEETVLNTKKKLASSLKKFMTVKSLNKISVTDIIKDCNLNRKTFYYHFENIYDLLKWILEEEAIEVVKKFNMMIDYEEAILFVIDYIEKNSHILVCAYDSLGREEMKRFLYNDFIEIIRVVIDETEKELKIEVSQDFKMFICNFYTEALAGMIINWFKEKKNTNKEQVIEYLLITLRSSIPVVLKNGALKF
ncbi:MAG: TetR/AcrR family transcriptional regulator C-terminal domain-containing protein [Clostridium sp.]|uniref:TetR/AcrR family transcriptional regulator C-terminal domain-containing protein n=1 Tax=Clostridium sp. TaxID=1506 RepID=UPI00290CE52F|nr:TetR/AcrR family transcriptional regulator C-terminal domain-containing protein [Clostridium sp.]MDU4937714.1 TetR/AcrR family transcriptional regulator C-terminal domain-containing protein [Clostridium sp.]